MLAAAVLHYPQTVEGGQPLGLADAAPGAGRWRRNRMAGRELIEFYLNYCKAIFERCKVIATNGEDLS